MRMGLVVAKAEDEASTRDAFTSRSPTHEENQYTGAYTLSCRYCQANHYRDVP